MITLLTICHAFTCICTIILFLCVVSLKNRNIELEAKLEYLESVCSKTTEICKNFKIRAWIAEKQADIYQDRCKTIEVKMLKNLMRLHRIESADKITKAYFQGYNKGKKER